MPGNAGPPLTLSHNTGITGLQARQPHQRHQPILEEQPRLHGIKVTRNGAVIAASLPGSTTSYVDHSPPAGRHLHRGTDRRRYHAGGGADDRQRRPAGRRGDLRTLRHDLGSHPQRERRRDRIGRPMGRGHGPFEVTSGSHTFGIAPRTYGNRIIRTSASGSCTIDIGDPPRDAGLMDDGADLWFSFLCPNPNNTSANPTPCLELKSSPTRPPSPTRAVPSA